MKLKNPFPPQVRLNWFGEWECLVCGGNGTDVGGLELHHIAGRVSGSMLNACCVCKECHSRMGHNEKEEKRLFGETLAFCINNEVELDEKDLKFIEEYPRLKEVIKSNQLFQEYIENHEYKIT